MNFFLLNCVLVQLKILFNVKNYFRFLRVVPFNEEAVWKEYIMSTRMYFYFLFYVFPLLILFQFKFQKFFSRFVITKIKYLGKRLLIATRKESVMRRNKKTNCISFDFLQREWLTMVVHWFLYQRLWKQI